MPTRQKSQLELGADAVRTGYQHRFPVAARRQGKKPAESAESRQDFRPVGAFDEGLDSIDQLVAGIDVDTGALIGQWLHRRYNSAWASTGKPPLLKSRLTILLLVIVAAPVWPVEVASLYTAQVPLDQEQDDPRAVEPDCRFERPPFTDV